jgi:hypothetical protein
MTQPTFVPIAEADQVRPARHLHVPGAWTTSRPAELVVPRPGPQRGRGTPGTDSGFALRLAKRFEHDLQLEAGESEHDVILGVGLIAAKRAALFGRGPSVYDVRFALNLWGFLGPVPADVKDARRAAFSGVGHDYTVQRALVDGISEETLRRSPEDARAGAASA